MTTSSEVLYYDHNGRGPGIARIVAVIDGVVYLERKSNEKAKRWSRFSLSKKAFESRSCGWKMKS